MRNEVEAGVHKRWRQSAASGAPPRVAFLLGLAAVPATREQGVSVGLNAHVGDEGFGDGDGDGELGVLAGVERNRTGEEGGW